MERRDRQSKFREAMQKLSTPRFRKFRRFEFVQCVELQTGDADLTGGENRGFQRLAEAARRRCDSKGAQHRFHFLGDAFRVITVIRLEGRLVERRIPPRR